MSEDNKTLTAEKLAYDTWFRAKVQEALDDPRPPISHEEARARMEKLKAELLARHPELV